MIITKIGDATYRKGRVLRADLTPDCENSPIKYLDIPYEHVEAILSVLHQSQDSPMHSSIKRLLEEAYDAHIECRKTKKDPKTIQVGGSHYTRFEIQPIEFIMKNHLGFAEGCIIKYICRYKNKNGLEDLDKAIHYIEFLKKQCEE